MGQDGRRRITVCWISSARYSKPLNATDARKWELISHLQDYAVHVIGFSSALRPLRFEQRARFHLIPQPPASLLRYLTFFALAAPLLLYLVWRHDARILVAQSPFEGAIAAWVKGVVRWFGKRPRLIIENHNNFEEDLFLQRSIPLQGAYRWLMLGAARYAFHRGDALRVISSSTSERARHYAPRLPQVRFMTFSDTEIFREAERQLPVNEATDIVYAGVLIPRKGVHLLLDAFAALDNPSAQLQLVGHPENAQYAASLQARARELNITERVHFVGGVSQAQLAEYFGRARVMALPSLSEGLGRVVVEAMLLGTPVIGSRVGGIPDLVSDCETGYLVAAGDVGALTTALRRIFATDVTTMGANAREFALEYFSPETYLEGYRQLFELVTEQDNSLRAST